MNTFANIPKHCPDCGTPLNPSQNHASMFTRNLVAAQCGCWTNWRVYDQETGRVLSFEEMGPIVGMVSDAEFKEGQLTADIYGFARHIYERMVFDYHQKCEDAGLWATRWDLHRFCAMDPRCRCMDENSFRWLFGDGGGDLAERLKRADQSKRLRGFCNGPTH
jgi:hypothetical protein